MLSFEKTYSKVICVYSAFHAWHHNSTSNAAHHSYVALHVKLT